MTDTNNAATERPTITFTHYQTGEERVVAVPNKLQQYTQAFIAAYITSKEHCEFLPWYREMREAVFNATKEANPNSNQGDLQIKAFPQIRIEFVKKFYPEHAPKEKAKKVKKPAKLNMWDI